MNNFALQNYIENGNTSNFPDQKYKKSTKQASQQLELTLATVFNQIRTILEHHQIELQLPQQPKSIQKVQLMKNIVEELIKGNNPSAQLNQSGVITCSDCKNYQTSLQKLQNQVRQHIRLEQQLKIFQDSQEEKIDQLKKQKKDYDKKIESFKKQIQDLKNFNATITEKVNKLETDNDGLKKQLRQAKRTVSTHQQVLHTKRQSQKPNSYALQSKENWVHRNVSIKKQQKQKQVERRSIEKRPESAEKNWRNSVNAKSTKMISIMNDKMIHEKTKQDRRKIIQSKFQYRK